MGWILLPELSLFHKQLALFPVLQIQVESVLCKHSAREHVLSRNPILRKPCYENWDQKGHGVPGSMLFFHENQT